MEDLLKDLLDGRLTLEEAKRELEMRLYSKLHHNIDPGRRARTGVPEVVLAEGKTLEQTTAIVKSFLDRDGRALVSRLEAAMVKDLERAVHRTHKGAEFEYDDVARFLVVRRKGFVLERTGGKVGFLTAGTSDIPPTTEAELTSREMGCDTKAFYDVGVAGVHRVIGPLTELLEWGADAIVVAAGREGALPTLVSGLVSVPVIGLPISTGYGLHGKGETALFAMLQSCSPIAVVNIDAGFVAGAIAGRIANRAASVRSRNGGV